LAAGFLLASGSAAWAIHNNSSLGRARCRAGLPSWGPVGQGATGESAHCPGWGAPLSATADEPSTAAVLPAPFRTAVSGHKDRIDLGRGGARAVAPCRSRR